MDALSNQKLTKKLYISSPLKKWWMGSLLFKKTCLFGDYVRFRGVQHFESPKSMGSLVEMIFRTSSCRNLMGFLFMMKQSGQLLLEEGDFGGIPTEFSLQHARRKIKVRRKIPQSAG